MKMLPKIVFLVAAFAPAFLAAEDAGYITGATLTVNGGQYITG